MKIALLLTAISLLPWATPARPRPARPVPEAATSIFRRTFPAATRVVWQQQERTYQVSFVQQQVQRVAVFTSAGELLETQTLLTDQQLPPLAGTTMSQLYPHRQIDRVLKVVTANGTVNYVAKVCPGKDKKGKDKGCQTRRFDQDGRLLKDG